MLRSVFVFVLSLLWANLLFAAPSVVFNTSEGEFVIELYPEKAPKTVENFLQYVEDGFYKNTIFHRVINRFMVQGGGFTREMMKKDTHAPIENEAANGLLNLTGTIAMARTQEPDSATSQFYINLVDNQSLDYTGPGPATIGYCVFGQVTKGMDVIYKIGRRPTRNHRGHANVPIRPIVIKKVTLLTEEKAAAH